MSRRGRDKGKGKSELRRINPRAAGVDIGSASHWVAIDPSLSEQPVREFAAYTGDIQALASWLVEHGVETVAMEATGVYWWSGAWRSAWNVKLTEVVSDITGFTGLAIIAPILAGERDAGRLSELRDPRCSRSQDEIARSLLGAWREEHLFALGQARDYYRYLGDRIAACDAQIAAVMTACASVQSADLPPRPGKRGSTTHPFSFNAHDYCYRSAGVD